MKNLSCFQTRLDELLLVSCTEKVKANQEFFSVFTYNTFH